MANPITLLENWRTARRRKAAVKTAGQGIDIPIFYFHQIGEDEETQHPSLYLSQKDFKKCIHWLVSGGYQCISLSKAVEMIRSKTSSGQKYAVLTFDDGYEGVYTAAFEVLQQYQCHATVFLIAGEIDTSASTSFPYLQSPQLREMIRHGIEMGSHSYHHLDLTALSNEESLKAEIQDSKRSLEDLLGTEIRHFCYPLGKWNAAAADWVKRAGYQSACSTRLGRWHTAEELFHLSRISIPFHQNFPYFLYRLEIMSWAQS